MLVRALGMGLIDIEPTKIRDIRSCGNGFTYVTLAYGSLIYVHREDAEKLRVRAGLRKADET